MYYYLKHALTGDVVLRVEHQITRDLPLRWTIVDWSDERKDALQMTREKAVAAAKNSGYAIGQDILLVRVGKKR